MASALPPSISFAPTTPLTSAPSLFPLPVIAAVSPRALSPSPNPTKTPPNGSASSSSSRSSFAIPLTVSRTTPSPTAPPSSRPLLSAMSRSGFPRVPKGSLGYRSRKLANAFEPLLKSMSTPPALPAANPCPPSGKIVSSVKTNAALSASPSAKLPSRAATLAPAARFPHAIPAPARLSPAFRNISPISAKPLSPPGLPALASTTSTNSPPTPALPLPNPANFSASPTPSPSANAIPPWYP